MVAMAINGSPARSEVLAFGRWLKCLLAAKGGGEGQARQMYESRYPHSSHHDAFDTRTIGDAIQKAATQPLLAAGSPLNNYERLAGAWLSHVYPRTVLGRLTGQRQAPMGTEFPAVAGGSSFGWVGEGGTIKVSALSLEMARLSRLTVSGISVVSDELARHSSPDAETLIASDMQNSAVAALDRAFLDPTLAAVPDISPASITNGVTAIQNASPTSTSRAFEDAFASLSSDLSAPFIVMGPKTVLALIVQGGADRLYPDLRVTGGNLWGVPVLVSSSAPAGSATIIDAALLLTGRGIPFFDTARNATAELDDNPDGTGTQISLWQRNLVGLRLKLAANWQMGQAGGVAHIQNLPELGAVA